MPVDKRRAEIAHTAARSRVFKRAGVHVRLTEDLMEKLIDTADIEQQTVSHIVRTWIEEKLSAGSLESRVSRLESEVSSLKSARLGKRA